MTTPDAATEGIPLRFAGSDHHCAAGETVLECLERQGHAVPSFCRSGVCQSCLLRAVDGAVPPAAQVGLKPAWKKQGYFLSCVCKPETPLVVEPCDITRSLRTRILEVEPLSARVLRVSVLTPAEFEFEAGQFIQLTRPSNGTSRPYSIASLPGDGVLELHVALLENGQMSQWLAGAAGEAVDVRGPFGDCFYQADDADCPLILAGTGTGMAPLLGVLRAALRAGHRGPLWICHGSVTCEGLYLWNELIELGRGAPQLRVIGSVLSDAEFTQDAQRAGIERRPLDQMVLEAAKAATSPRVYLCGDAELVRSLRKKLFLQGLSLQRIHADPFVAPAPVPPKVPARADVR